MQCGLYRLVDFSAVLLVTDHVAITQTPPRSSKLAVVRQACRNTSLKIKSVLKYNKNYCNVQSSEKASANAS